MKPKPVIPRERAHQDVLDAVDYYRSEAGVQVALDFIAAMEHTLERVAHHPLAGSPRYAHELDLPGLRYWRLTRFPYLVFYVDRPDHVDVWRVLHATRDIPKWLRDPDTGQE